MLDANSPSTLKPMKIISSSPTQSADKPNFRHLCSLGQPETPFDDAPPKDHSGQALVLLTAKLDISSLVRDELIAEWVLKGGQVVLVVGNWSQSSNFSVNDAKMLITKGTKPLPAASLNRVVQFYCVDQMHAKLAARCTVDQNLNYTVESAILGSTNLTSGALKGSNYELDVLIDEADATDQMALSALSTYVTNLLATFRSGINVNASSALIQKEFDNWREFVVAEYLKLIADDLIRD